MRHNMSDYSLENIKRRMQGALESLQKEFSGIRTGRASSALLEPLMVDAYGSLVPITQVASINVPEPRMISVQVWDKTMVQIVEKAIRESDLGLNPMPDGQLIRVPMPELSAERRVELTKVAAKYAEQSRIAVRNVRRDGMEQLKKLEKDGEISEDEQARSSKDVQSATDEFIKKIDELLSQKDKDISQV